jgi:hypothetical protein
MPVIALITWVVAALGGLFLLVIWLIEYDPDFQRAAATRLPVPVVTSHVLLAVGGLGVWVGYLITDSDNLARIALAILAAVVLLGLTMAVRWVGVYRSRPVAVLVGDSGPARAGQGGQGAQLAVPPERHFPVSVVIGHGIFAGTTLVLVQLTVLGVGGS